MPILVTDGGDHTPDKWALATAQMLAPVDLNAPNARAVIDLQGKIADALQPHHAKVQDAERASLAAAGEDHLTTPYTAGDYVDEAFAEVEALFRALPDALVRRAIPGASSDLDNVAWNKFPDNEAWATAVKHMIGSHFTTSQFSARSWHCDRPGASEAAIAWKNAHHGDQSWHEELVETDDEPAAAEAAS